MDVPHIIAGRFRIECEIGTGGMGTVYRAAHLGLERPVAVKIIKPEFAADPDVADRFMREARTMARLRHPNAAMIFDAGVLPDGRHFIVMEFVEGHTLSEALTREGQFTPERAVKIATDICDVLAEAHKLGIIHRDLKPSNIMLNERGTCVLDFGVAKVLATSTDATATHATTGSGVIIGTPRYMSPEQCLGQRVGARSDLYSLGVLLYEMLAGQPPFVDALPSAVLVKQATASPPPLPNLRKDVPHALALAVHTLLAKRPEDRPKTAEAARQMLERSLRRPEVNLPEAQPFAGTVSALEPRRGIIFRSVTAASIIAALGLFLFIWSRTGLTAQSPALLSAAAMGAPASLSNARRSASPSPALTKASLDDSGKAASAPVNLPYILTSTEKARQIVNALSHGEVSDVRVVRTPDDAAIVALHDERHEGRTHFFVMEKKGKDYRITARAPLDTAEFSGAEWQSETFDADGDGFDEVLYVGRDAHSSSSLCRLVLYVPRTREAYSLRIDGNKRRAQRAVWSANTVGQKAAPYRAALQQQARLIIGNL